MSSNLPHGSGKAYHVQQLSIEVYYIISYYNCLNTIARLFATIFVTTKLRQLLN